jgi:hypothetical protein
MHVVGEMIGSGGHPAVIRFAASAAALGTGLPLSTLSSRVVVVAPGAAALLATGIGAKAVLGSSGILWIATALAPPRHTTTPELGTIPQAHVLVQFGEGLQEARRHLKPHFNDLLDNCSQAGMLLGACARMRW